MRILILLLLSALVLGFNVVDNCGYGVDRVNNYANDVYNTYCSVAGKCPALCPGFYIETKQLQGAGGLAYFSISGGGVCVYKIEITCGLSDFSLRYIIAHEFGHALQASFMKYPDKFDGWFVEATPESITTLYMQNKTGTAWHQFWSTRAYYSEELYKINPFSIPMYSEKLYEYKYAGAVAWLMLRYGVAEVFKQYSIPNLTYIQESYIRFLLSPWQWPYRPEFVSILLVDRNMEPFTGRYAYEFRDYIREPGELIVASNVYVNASLSDYLYLAFASTSSATLSHTITVRPCSCPNVTTTTVTVTVTETHTTTVPVTTTTTYTTIIPVTITTTYTTTIPITTTTTYTTTIPITVTTTYTTTETYVTTYTTTVPVTTTVIRNVTTTVTDVITTTLTITQPITITHTETVTETITGTQVGDYAIILTIAILMMIIAIIICGRRPACGTASEENGAN